MSQSADSAPSSAPGFAAHPDHRIKIAPAAARVRVRFAGATVADSDRALEMREADYPPVYYLPRADVRVDLLRPTDHATTCPFKGAASYWSIHVGETRAENAVWSYETPYREVARIAGHLAFYPDRTEIACLPRD